MGNDLITELGTINPGADKTETFNLFLGRVDSTINLGYPLDTGTVRQPCKMSAFCTGDWKIVQYVDPKGVENEQWELYCLTSDPNELTNLVDYRTGIIREDVSVPGMTAEELRLKNIYLKEQLANATSVSETGTSPKQITLFQNLPNPFSRQTTIPFYIPQSGPVQLTVNDMTGKELQILVNKTLPAGSHKYNFDASQLPSGVYLVKLKVNSQMVVKKMIQMK
jgi:hypothetical protein